MKLLYGTQNRAKLDHMRALLAPLGLEIFGPEGLLSSDETLPRVEESGRSPLENARLKAQTYYRQFHMPVFSCDSGLYFSDLPDELQPGTHIRRIGGKNLSDEEMVVYYSGLAAQHGGRLTAQYRNAICLILSEELVYESMDPSLAGTPFLLTDKPHPRQEAGFPLDRLSLERESGVYYYDLPARDVGGKALEKSFTAFFRSVPGLLSR